MLRKPIWIVCVDGATLCAFERENDAIRNAAKFRNTSVRSIYMWSGF